MPWLKVEYDCGNCVIAYKYFAARWNSKGKVVYNKTNKKGELTVHQQRCNDRRLQRYYDALANTNFTEGDIFVTYTFGRGRLPEGENDEVIQKCKNIWKYYRAKLRNYYRSQNAELKYMYAFQFEGVRPHFHIICNSADGINIKDFPKWKYGTPKIEFLDDRPRHTIGSYFARGTTVMNSEGVEEHKRGLIRCSRNLVQPGVRRRKLKRSGWNCEPKPKKGYLIVKDTVENGYYISPNDGQPYQYQSYTMIKQERMIS